MRVIDYQHLFPKRQTVNTIILWKSLVSLATTTWRALRQQPYEMEGSWKYIEKAVGESIERVVIHLGGWAGHQNLSPCYKVLHSVPDIADLFNRVSRFDII
jgi:hypothetical protein